jgi:hypothetical protein
MSSRKPQGKAGRLPTDYAEARKQGQTAADFTGGTAADLVIPSMPPGEREARAEAAVRYLLRHNAADIVDVLGLGEEPKPPGPTGQLSVPCPACGVKAGARCKASSGGTYQHGHVARRLRADELREAAA